MDAAPATLNTLDPKMAAAPVSRIGDAANALALARRFLRNDKGRAELRTRVRGQYSGFAPYRRADIKPADTNLNFRQHKAQVDQVLAMFYNLLSSTPLLADIQTAEGQDGEREEWSEIISYEFDRAVKSWSGWDHAMQFTIFEMVGPGIGLLIHPDEITWIPDVARMDDVLVDDQSPCKMEALECAVVIRSLPVTELYQRIRDPDTTNWNVPAVERAIMAARWGYQRIQSREALEWYQRFKNADLAQGRDQCQNVQMATILSREFDGRISQHIVDLRGDAGSPAAGRGRGKTGEFLYEKTGKFAQMEEVIYPFFYSISDTWHGVSGMGKEIFPFVEVLNRLNGKKVDGAMRAASLIVKATTPDALQKIQNLTLGDGTILPPGVELPVVNLGPGLQATMQVAASMEQMLNQNIGSQGRPVSAQTSDRRPWHQVNLEAQQSGQLSTANAARFYTQQDVFLRGVYKRMINPDYPREHAGGKQAREFQERCKKQGVPQAALENIDSIFACRAIGAGSLAAQMDAQDWLMEHAESFPEESRRQILRVAAAGRTNVQTMRSILGRQKVRPATDDDVLIGIENGLLADGADKLVITAGQSAVKHATGHLAAAEEEVAKLDAQAASTPDGMDIASLQKLALVLDATGHHTDAHLESLQGDKMRAGDYKILSKRWQMLSRIADKVHQQLAQMIYYKDEQKDPRAANPVDLNRLLKFSDMPEGTKRQALEMAGFEVADGDLSVSAQKLMDKRAQIELAAAKTQQALAAGKQEMAHKDVALAQDIRAQANPEKAKASANATETV